MHDPVQAVDFLLVAVQLDDLAVADDALEVGGPAAGLGLVGEDVHLAFHLEAHRGIGRDELQLFAPLSRMEIEPPPIVPEKERRQVRLILAGERNAAHSRLVEEGVDVTPVGDLAVFSSHLLPYNSDKAFC